MRRGGDDGGWGGGGIQPATPQPPSAPTGKFMFGVHHPHVHDWTGTKGGYFVFVICHVICAICVESRNLTSKLTLDPVRHGKRPR